jgi:hypothetical protein
MRRRSSNSLNPLSLLVGLFALPMFGSIVLSADVSREEIASILAKNREAIRSIIVRYQVRSVPLVSRTQMIRMGFIGSPSEETTTGWMDSKIYLKIGKRDISGTALRQKLRADDPNFPEDSSWGEILKRIPPERLARILDKLTPEETERLLVCDGAVVKEPLQNELVDLGVKRSMTTVTPAKPRPYRYFPETYLDRAGLGAVDPCGGRTAMVGATDRLLAQPDARVQPGTFPVQGTPCIKVRIGDEQAVWLDPKLSYAVRRQEFYNNGQMVLELECRDFEEILPQVWFPKVVERYAYQDGRRIFHMTDRATKVEVNQPDHAEYFALEPKPGSFVVDRTVDIRDAEGKPAADGPNGPASVTYVQPRDKADVAQVVQEALDTYEASTAKSRTHLLIRKGLLIGAGVGLIVVLIEVLGRRVRSRHALAQKQP